VNRDLVERAQRGDSAAFAELATLISDRLFAIARRILRDPDEAGDALQASLVRIWRDLPTLRDPDKFEGWSYRVAVRCCQATRRQAHRSVGTLELLPAHAAMGDAQSAVALQDELEQAFRSLTHEQRAVLVLTYYRDMPIEAVADVVGVSVGTVKSRLHYARKAMRAAVEANSRSPEREGHVA
jgi:RNA polymerase sigma-70 factor (ECF subfamily)